MRKNKKWNISKQQQLNFISALEPELAALRAKIGISQGELSNVLGISRQTYSAIEGGKRRMSWSTYLSLILFYDYNGATHQMIRSVNAFPEELVNNFNGGAGSPYENEGGIAGIPQEIVDKLDPQAYHAIRTVVMVEYARCTNTPGDDIVKAFNGMSFFGKTKAEDVTAQRSLRNLLKNAEDDQ